MLQLKGNAAVIMFVAKGGLAEIPEIVPRLKAGIAVMAGLTDMHSVRDADIQRSTAQLMDELIAQGLLSTASQDVLSYVHMMTAFSPREPRQSLSAEDLLVGGFICAMRAMRIRKEAGSTLLVDWTSALPPGLELEALELYRRSNAPARSQAVLSASN